MVCLYEKGHCYRFPFVTDIVCCDCNNRTKSLVLRYTRAFEPKLHSGDIMTRSTDGLPNNTSLSGASLTAFTPDGTSAEDAATTQGIYRAIVSVVNPRCSVNQGSRVCVSLITDFDPRLGQFRNLDRVNSELEIRGLGTYLLDPDLLGRIGSQTISWSSLI